MELHEKYPRLNRFLRSGDDARHPSLTIVANRLDNEFDGLVDIFNAVVERLIAKDAMSDNFLKAANQ